MKNNLKPDDLIPMDSLNTQGLFHQVYLSKACFEGLAEAEQKTWLKIVGKCMDGLSNIKNDPAYCEFLSNELGHDFSKGFATMAESPLILTAEKLSDLGECYFLSSNVGKAGYTNMVNINPQRIKEASASEKSFTIAHEMGHALIHAAEMSEDNNTLFKLATRSFKSPRERMKYHWQNEFNADKIACAINPEEHQFNLPTTMTQAYRKGRLSPSTARLLSGFYATRDSLLAPALDRMSMKGAQVVRSLIDAEAHITHPPTMTRAVEADRFTQKAKSFLSTP